jgi:hypothetical protein
MLRTLCKQRLFIAIHMKVYVPQSPVAQKFRPQELPSGDSPFTNHPTIRPQTFALLTVLLDKKQIKWPYFSQNFQLIKLVDVRLELADMDPLLKLVNEIWNIKYCAC